jgi:hypothetical protein
MKAEALTSKLLVKRFLVWALGIVGCVLGIYGVIVFRGSLEEGFAAKRGRQMVVADPKSVIREPSIHIKDEGHNNENVKGETKMTSLDPYERASDPAYIADMIWSMMGFGGMSSRPYFVTGAYQVNSKEEGKSVKDIFEKTGKYKADVQSVIDDDNDGREYVVVSIKTENEMTLTKQLLIETIKDMAAIANEHGFKLASFSLEN